MSYTKKLKVRGARPAGWPSEDHVALCEGIAKPGKLNAHWRLVAWIDRAALAPLNATRRQRQALNEAKAAAKYASEPTPERRQELQAAVRAAKKALAAAEVAERNWLAMLADPALGVAFVPGDCADVEFVGGAS